MLSLFHRTLTGSIIAVLLMTSLPTETYAQVSVPTLSSIVSSLQSILLRLQGQKAQVVGATGPIAAFNFNEGTGNVVTDVTGNGYTTTFTGTPDWTTGKYGTAPTFGSGDNVNLESRLPLQGIQKLTISAWMKRGAQNAIVNIGKEGNGGDNSISMNYWTDGLLYFSVGATANTYVGGSTPLNDTTWHHVAMVFDGTQTGNANRLKGYVDGQPVTLSFTGTIPSQTTTATNNFTLGYINGSYSSGQMDDVRIYTRTLTQAEIQSDMNTALGGATTTPPPTTAAPIISLSASPTSITSGQSSTLSWTTLNATTCTASGGWTGTRATSGTQSVSPTSNTTYTLSCTGAGGTTNQSVAVSVSGVTPPSTGSLASIAAGMAAGSWAAITTNNINPTLITNGADGNVLGYTNDIVYDPATKKFIYYGGDHAAFRTFAEYNENTNTWALLPTAAWMPDPSDYNNGMEHGYDHSAIDTARGYFYHRPRAQLQVYRYTVATGAWTTMPDRPTSGQFGSYMNCCDALEYFPELGGLVWVAGDGVGGQNNGHVYLLSDSTNQWSVLSSSVDLAGTMHLAEYNPVHKVLVFYSAETNKMYKLDSSRQVTQIATPPFSMYDGSSYMATLTADPVSGKYIALSATSRQMYTYDVPTNTWQSITATGKPNLSGTPVVASPVGPYGVMFYAACKVGASNNCQAYLYKHATGSTTTPTPTTPAVSLIASPTSVTTGGATTLSWVSTNATSCTASGGWTGTKATSGTQSVSPSANTTYTLTCTGTGGNATQSVFVTVTAPVSTKFSQNDRVQVVNGPLNVRSTANTTGTLLGTQSTGALGTIVGGPTAQGGFTWWNINYDAGVDGWSVEDYLSDYVAPTTPPPTGTTTGSADFSTRCTAAGVVKCVGFDAATDFNTGSGGTTGAYGQNYGIYPPSGTSDYTKATQDTTQKASGNSSLRFTIPSNSGSDTSGSWFTNFSPDLSTQFDSGDTFYVQWRQRFSPEYLTTNYTGSGGWKQVIIGTGDQPGKVYSSCSALELPVQNTYLRSFPVMYNSCTGSTSHGPYHPFEEPFNGYDFKLQNARPSPYCLYSQSSGGYFPPNGNCFKYQPNEWMTFQVGITLGQRQGDEFKNSYIRLWVAREGQPAELVMDWGPYNLTAGPLSENQRFGKVWLTPYQTGKSSSQAHATAYTWYDELIVSRNRIADPSSSGTTTPTPTPTISLSASPTSITSGQSSTLSWSSSNATSCTASGGWTGTKATSGTQSVSPTANTTYTLSCTGAGGTTNQSVTVTVTTVTPPVSTANPFDNLYATNFALRTLSADAIPNVTKPTSKATGLSTPSFIDPVYSTRVYKVTDASDFPNATHVRHDYSRRQAFNADNTRFLAVASNGFWLLYDANTFQRLTRSGTNGALKGMAGDAEAFWHPTDPTKLWYTTNAGGLIWYEKNVETDTDTVLVNFTGRLPWSGVTGMWTKAEGVPSADGRYFAFMATSYNSATQSNVIHGLVTWDRQTDTILGTLPASAFGNAFPDHISMAPSGKYVVPSWAFNRSLGTRAYPLNFSSSIQLHDMSEHSDLAIGPNGEDYYVTADYDSGYIRAVNVETGASFNMMSLYPASGASYANHISGKAYGRPGWVLISTYGDCGNYGNACPDSTLQPMYRKLILAELKPNGKQLNVAHTRATANYGGYFGEHQATISRDGSRILFATNFNDGGSPSSYMIGLPSWVYTTSGGTTPPPQDTTAPTAPGTPAVTPLSASSLSLTWSASSDATGVTGYRVERCQGASCTTYTQIATPTGTTYTDTGLSANTVYRYRIRATDAAGNLSTYSTAGQGTTNSVLDTIAPTTPGTPTITAPSLGTLSLTWTPSTDAASGLARYRIERCQGTSCTGYTEVGTPTTPAFVNTGLQNGTTYRYRVRAEDQSGNLSPYTTAVALSTLSAPVTDTTAPTLTNVQASGSANAAVISATTNEPARLRVDYGTSAGSLTNTLSTTTLTTAHALTLPSLTRRTTYWYRVTVTDQAGNSTPGTVLSFTTGKGKTAPLTNLNAVYGSVILSWGALQDPFARTIAIHRTTNGTFPAVTDTATRIATITDLSTRTYRDTTAQNGTTYSYTLYVIDDEGTASDPAMITFTPKAPTSSGGGGGGGGGGKPKPKPTTTPVVTTPTLPSTPVITPPTTPSTPTTVSTPAFTEPLFVGSQNAEVLRLQQFLIKQGFLAADSATGLYGPATEAAVKRYQCARNIVCTGTGASTGYGLVGNATRARLNQEVPPVVTTTTPTTVSTPTTLTPEARAALIQSLLMQVQVLMERLRVMQGR